MQAIITTWLVNCHAVVSATAINQPETVADHLSELPESRRLALHEKWPTARVTAEPTSGGEDAWLGNWGWRLVALTPS